MFSVAFRSSSLSFGTRKYRDISAVDVVQIFKSVAGFDWMTRKSDVIRRVSNLRDELHRSLRTHRDLKSKKSEKDFIDKTRIKAAAGAGGRGAFSFVPVRRIPDGGDGGPGGSVLLRATSDVRSLAGIAFLQRASDGINGGSQRRQGRSGSPRVVLVPLGTTVSVEQQSGAVAEGDGRGAEVLADLSREGDEVVVARGGDGGMGNARLASRGIWGSAQGMARAKGAAGESRTVVLELKSIADVGLVGLPNAGKSTMLRSISAATPKVGSFPFTTLRPHLGVVCFPDGRRATVADIPGIIRGAHENRGLGHEFLRHIERTSVLVYVVDATLEHEPGGRGGPLPPLEQLMLLQEELGRYDRSLLAKPSLVAANKLDAAAPIHRGAVERLRSGAGLPVFEVSGLTGEGLHALLDAVWQSLPPDRP